MPPVFRKDLYTPAPHAYTPTWLLLLLPLPHPHFWLAQTTFQLILLTRIGSQRHSTKKNIKKSLAVVDIFNLV